MKRIFLGIAVLIGFSASAFSAFSAFSALAATHRVPQDFKTIQSAIDAAKPGDTVLVAPGKYPEALNLKSGITLQADTSGEVVLTEQVTAKNVKDAKIEGFKIVGGTEDSHFAISCESSTLTARKNLILNWHHALTANFSKLIAEENTISGSYRAGASTGIDLFSCADSMVKRNKVIDNEGSAVIVTDPLGPISVLDNIVARNTGNGIECANVTLKVKFRNNLITNNAVGIWVKSGNADFGTATDFGSNVIYSNKKQDLVNLGKEEIQAQQNYWGTPNGPDIAKFEGKVNFKPWLKADPSVAQAVEPKEKLTTTWAQMKRF